jgi:hypothetical protein
MLRAPVAFGLKYRGEIGVTLGADPFEHPVLAELLLTAWRRAGRRRAAQRSSGSLFDVALTTDEREDNDETNEPEARNPRADPASSNSAALPASFLLPSLSSFQPETATTMPPATRMIGTEMP